jgi:hypothetical protein
MGAQSDFVAEQFVPSEAYKAEQRARVEQLLAAGLSPEEVARMFSVPLELVLGEESEP